MAPLSLSQLLDVAIGTPEIGAVNFRALYSLLQAVLGHLGVQDLPAPGHDQPPKAPLREEGAQGRGPGTELLTPSKDPLQGTVSTPHDASMAADMGQMKRKIEENKSSVSKDIALSQDLLEEIGRMKAAQSRIEEDVRTIQETLGMGNLQDAAGQLLALRDQTALDSDVVRPHAHLAPAPGWRQLHPQGTSARSPSVSAKAEGKTEPLPGPGGGWQCRSGCPRRASHCRHGHATWGKLSAGTEGTRDTGCTEDQQRDRQGDSTDTAWLPGDTESTSGP
ncbi:uncharacterized protein LOC113486682 isoform X2 [Athene cunicularia]|uniref:uncharacterized protein LOC113486682 isoform X2 n=1 Tax=Athene cunicularia TaxID=194338 RepID=UPI000EF70D02|nr:uncharacterized protein LOC113486682 isoform X2 [Athene cunicularia]